MPIMYKDGDKMRKIAKIMYLDNITNTIKTITSCKGLVNGKLLDFLSGDNDIKRLLWKVYLYQFYETGCIFTWTTQYTNSLITTPENILNLYLDGLIDEKPINEGNKIINIFAKNKNGIEYKKGFLFTNNKIYLGDYDTKYNKGYYCNFKEINTLGLKDESFNFDTKNGQFNIEKTYTNAICCEVVNGTSLTGTVNTKMGDYILATITARSVLTLPTDWTLLKTLGPVDIGDTNQTMSFAYKKVQMDGDISLTVKQANTGRMYLNLIALSDVNGVEYAEEYEKVVKEEVASVTTVDKKESEKLIWGCSAVNWGSGTWTTSNKLALICLDPNITAPRQANFVDFGNNVVNIFTPASNGSQCIIGAVRLK